MTFIEQGKQDSDIENLIIIIIIIILIISAAIWQGGMCYYGNTASAESMSSEPEMRNTTNAQSGPTSVDGD